MNVLKSSCHSESWLDYSTRRLKDYAAVDDRRRRRPLGCASAGAPPSGQGRRPRHENPDQRNCADQNQMRPGENSQQAVRLVAIVKFDARLELDSQPQGNWLGHLWSRRYPRQ
jgi:hypothetical protein